MDADTGKKDDERESGGEHRGGRDKEREKGEKRYRGPSDSKAETLGIFKQNQKMVFTRLAKPGARRVV